jgi:hypothetical protein
VDVDAGAILAVVLDEGARGVHRLDGGLHVVDGLEPEQRHLLLAVRPRRPLELVAQVDDRLDAERLERLDLRVEERRLPQQHRRLLVVDVRPPLPLELVVVAGDRARRARPEVAAADALAAAPRAHVLLEDHVRRDRAAAAEQDPEPHARRRAEVRADPGKRVANRSEDQVVEEVDDHRVPQHRADVGVEHVRLGGRLDLERAVERAEQPGAVLAVAREAVGERAAPRRAGAKCARRAPRATQGVRWRNSSRVCAAAAVATRRMEKELGR